MSIQKQATKISAKLTSGLLLMLIFIALSQPATASVKSYKKDADGVSFLLNKGIMKIKICRDDIVEVKFAFINSFPVKRRL